MFELDKDSKDWKIAGYIYPTNDHGVGIVGEDFWKQFNCDKNAYSISAK